MKKRSTVASWSTKAQELERVDRNNVRQVNRAVGRFVVRGVPVSQCPKCESTVISAGPIFVILPRVTSMPLRSGFPLDVGFLCTTRKEEDGCAPCPWPGLPAIIALGRSR